MRAINFNTFNRKISQSFNTKNIKYGGYAALLTLLLVGMLVILNLIAGQIPFKLDWSRNRIFSLSEQTYQLLADLNKNITIYALYQSGQENTDITEILKKYSDHSKNVHLKFIDPNKNPGFIKRYLKEGENLNFGSLIVESGNKFKVIPAEDLFNFDYSNPYQPSVTSLAIEQRVTGAIMYLLSGNAPKIYTLEGHGEEPLPLEITKQLETNNYQLNSINLYTNSFPADINLLLINSPQNDLTGKEVNDIRAFLANGGRAIFMLDLLNETLPNLQGLLQSYGIALQRIAIIEGDSTRYIQNNPLWIKPEMSSHQILESLKSNKMPVIVPIAQGIEILDIKKRTLNIDPLLTSSNSAWGKTDLEKPSLDRTKNDLPGPFNIAVTVSENSSEKNGKEIKIVVIGNSMFASSEIISSIPGNANFLINCFNWLQDQKVTLLIEPKNLLTMRLDINVFQTLLLSGFVVFIIPFTVLGTGLLVWLRRRHL